MQLRMGWIAIQLQPFDRTPKSINPAGGFRHYGMITNKCLMIKGSVMGPQKRPILIKETRGVPPATLVKEQVDLKFIDTSSNTGIGRFQTTAEKRATMGLLKKDMQLEKAAFAKQN